MNLRERRREFPSPGGAEQKHSKCGHWTWVRMVYVHQLQLQAHILQINSDLICLVFVPHWFAYFLQRSLCVFCRTDHDLDIYIFNSSIQTNASTSVIRNVAFQPERMS